MISGDQQLVSARFGQIILSGEERFPFNKASFSKRITSLDVPVVIFSAPYLATTFKSSKMLSNSSVSVPL